MIVFPHLILKKEKQTLLTRRSPAQKLWPGIFSHGIGNA